MRSSWIFKKSSIIFILPILVVSCKQEPKAVEEKIIPKKPNIILIVTDDQGWGDLSMNENTNLKTPNIDSLAMHGAFFENFYVQPVCSPTRAEILTGRYHTRLGVYDTSAGGERFNLEETTLAELLKQAGYHTAAYGKWHSGMQPPYHPNARGFDDFYGFASGHWGNYFSPMLEHNGKIVKGEGYLPNDLTQHGIEFIETNAEKPFFLYLPYNTPHSPMQVPDNYWNRFKDKELVETYHGTEEENTDFTKAALAMVENIDDNVGKITQTLQERDLEKNTIIIFMSDNGPNSWRYNGGMRGRKGATDEGGVRSPFLMQWKGTIPEGKKVVEIAGAIDILPTLTEFTGITTMTKKPLDGKSLVPLLFDKNHSWNDRFLFNYWNDKTSVRSQDYRLDAENQLYDISKDRGQTKDLSTELPKIKDSLVQAKENWLKETQPLTKADDVRSYPLGHPDFEYTQIPARDGIPHGNIKRSNRWPNDSFFTKWSSVNDSITWDVEVLEGGKFEVELYYTLSEENTPVAVQIINGKSMLVTRITEAHDPPLIIPDTDRVPRGESYVKDFKAKVLGTVGLQKGRNTLILKAPYISGEAAMDVRLLLFRRID